MGNALENLRHLIDCYGWRDSRDMQDFIDAADMIDMQYVELPKDADGEYIRIGDVLTDDAEFKSEGKVMRLMLEDEGWMVGLGCGGWTWPSIHECHHYHSPTVNDLLFSYGQACIRTSNEAETDAAKQTMLARLREDYAAKLRLADYGKEQ